MKIKTLYDGTDIPVLGLGTGRIDPYGGDDQRAIEAIRTAIGLGITHIDTAESYGNGHSELLIGEAIQDLNRDGLFITTKVSAPHLTYRGVLEAISMSLKRLGTSWVDLYLIHSPNPEIPIAETFRALNELVADGRVRYVGVSNFDVEQTEAAQAVSNIPLATNQVYYSLAHRDPERDGVLDQCRRHNMLLTAYTPLEVGKLLSDPLVQQVAQHRGVTPTQVALAWLIHQPDVITIPASSRPEHVEEFAGAFDLELTGDDLRILEGVER